MGFGFGVVELHSATELSDLSNDLEDRISSFLTVFNRVGSRALRVSSVGVDDMLAMCMHSNAFSVFACTCRRYANLGVRHGRKIEIAINVIRDHNQLLELVVCNHIIQQVGPFGMCDTGLPQRRLSSLRSRSSTLTPGDRAVACEVADALNSHPQITGNEAAQGESPPQREGFSRARSLSVMTDLRMRVSELAGLASATNLRALCDAVQRTHDAIPDSEARQAKLSFIDMTQGMMC